MPYKSVERKKTRAGCFHIPTGLIIGLLLFVLFCVGSEVKTSWSKSLQEIEGKSLECLIEFEARKCNPFEMTEDCQKIKSCIQREGAVVDQENLEYLIKTINHSFSTYTGGITILLILLSLYQARRGQLN